MGRGSPPVMPSLAEAPARFEALAAAAHPSNFRQARAQRSYQALIKAATSLFASAGYEAVGTPEIAEKAGVAVGTFYRYFDDKRQVFYEVARHYLAVAYHQTLDGLTAEKFASKQRNETIRATVDILFSHVLAHPKMSRSITELALRDPTVAELRHAFDMACCARIATLFRAICDPALVPDADATAYIVYASAVECGNWIGGLRGTPPVEVERARAALTSLIERTLFSASP
ncbi:MAG TPA: TetR/AcrR family transcriptional regulator [Kofleriaceae bacterium]|nr:TetR/AcrR family transcriptional regulator [Kofleriaceae bacterium]